MYVDVHEVNVDVYVYYVDVDVSLEVHVYVYSVHVDYNGAGYNILGDPKNFRFLSY